MKKLFVSLFMMLAVISLTKAQHYTVKHSDYNSVSITFKSDVIQSESVKIPEGTFSKISMDEYYPSNEVGCPQLPVMVKMLEIPLCDSVIATVTNAQYEEFDAAELGIMHPIYPTQPSYPKSYRGEVRFVKNNEVYNTDAFYGDPLVRVEKSGTMRDVTLANIYVAPVQYNPVTNRVRVYKSVDVTVTYANANVPGTYELKSKFGSPMFKVATSSVINPIGDMRDEFSGAPIKYLIIANGMFADNDYLNQFIQWKKRIGYIVEVAYTSDPAVGTTTTSIKNYIMTHYNNATPENPAPTFLLLIGDVAQLPPFSSTTYNSHVTDLYYATWTNGDNLPDCYYGRFSAQNIAQLQPQIEKTLMYEQYTMPDPSYLGTAVLIAGTDASNAPTYGNGQINYIFNNYINTTSTSHNYTTVYKHLHDCSSQAATIRNEIGAGCGWANYTAHGGEDGWSQPAFNNSHVSAMQNANKYGIMIGNCCLTGKFNYSSDCFAETLLRTPNKGAVVYVGGSEVTIWNEDYYWAIGVRSSITANPTYDGNNLGAYDRTFHTHNESTADWVTTMGGVVQSGDMSVQSSNSSLKLYYWEIYHIFGDPSIRPYLGIPTQMNVTASDIILVGANSYQVQAAPFAYVALTHNNQLVAATFTNASGNGTLTFPALVETGEYELAIGAQNKIQYFKTVNVIVPQGAYLSSQSINLTPNSQPIAGSTVHWDLIVDNLGTATANSAYAKMTSSTPGVNMHIDSVYIGTIAANNSQTLSNAFSAQLPDNAEDMEMAAFTVTVYWNGGSSQKNIPLQIYAPKLVMDDYSIQAPNDATVIAPGDLVTVSFTNKNSGHAVLPFATVDLTSNYTGAVVTNPSYSIYTLQPEQTTTNIFTVQISSDISETLIVPLYYHRIYNNKHFIDTVYLTVGSAMETFESGNLSQYSWSTGGANPWEITDQSPYAGNYCARSKTGLGNSSTSSLSITMQVANNGNITFFRKVSSEQNYDKFTFSIDDNVLDEQSGTVAWSQASFPVTTGTHTYKFSYTKDWSMNSGSDCAWIDNVVFPGYGRPAPADTIDNVGITNYTIPTANVTVYPNPSSGQLTVSSNEAIRYISIYDLSGRLVETVNVNAETHVNLNVASLNSGIYFIKTQLENQQTNTSKFIKQ